ncbi:MAG: hypothetical protein QW474_01195 [Candidatus Aenigmatarchaeota archaeon]
MNILNYIDIIKMGYNSTKSFKYGGYVYSITYVDDLYILTIYDYKEIKSLTFISKDDIKRYILENLELN